MLTVDLPTPPLPAATAMMFFTPGSRGFEGWFGRPHTLAVSLTSTPLTPATAVTASVTVRVMTSRDGQAGVVSSIVTPTRSPAIVISLTIPAETKSVPSAGSFAWPRAARTFSSRVGMRAA